MYVCMRVSKNIIQSKFERTIEYLSIVMYQLVHWRVECQMHEIK